MGHKLAGETRRATRRAPPSESVEIMRKIYFPVYWKEELPLYQLLMLYRIAKYNPKTKRYDTIPCASLNDTLYHLKSAGYSISKSSLSRLLHGATIGNYLTQEPGCFRLITKASSMYCYVALEEKEIDLIISQHSQLFSKYLIYVKYYASKRASDFTARQFLEAVQLSVCNGNRNRCTACAKILETAGLLRVEHNRNSLQELRCVYRYSC